MALSLFGHDPWFTELSVFDNNLGRRMQKLQRQADASLRSLALDVTENDDGFTIAADLPGYNKDDVQLTVHEGVLSITAERKQEQEKTTDKEWRRERFHGKVQRSVQLPDTADDNAVSADFTNGVLKVVVGKKAVEDMPGPRRIAIGGDAGDGSETRPDSGAGSQQ